MVRPDGLVKVVDFGLAKPLAAPATALPPLPIVSLQTDPTLLMGTLAYLSPEQVRHQAVDHRTDIFSLGVVLYELLTGLRPFAGASAPAICDAILRDTPALPAHLPAPLPRIIKRALAKDATARYQTANALLNDLQPLLQTTNGATASWWAAWRAKAALGVIALLLLTGLWVWWRVSGTAAAPFTPGKITRLTDLPGQELYPSFAPDGQTIVYAGFASGNWNIYLQKIGERQAVNLTPENKYVDFSPIFSPDGKHIAFFSSRAGHGLFLMDRTGEILKRITDKGHNPSWSPDGSEIALADDRIFDYEGRNQGHSSLFAVNVATGARRPITGGDAVQPDWSPHGHRLAYWGIHKGGQRDIWTVAAHATNGAAEPVAVTDDRAVDWNPVWSPDGRHLYFLSNRGGSMNLWRVPIDEASGRVAGQPEPATLPSANSQHVSFSADGRALVYVEMNRREHTHQIAFDPRAGKVAGQATVLTRGARRHNSPALAPDESALAFASQGEAQEDIFVLERDHAQPRQLTQDAAQDRLPRWAPDGQSLAFISDRSGKYEVWRVQRDGSGLEQLTDARAAQVISALWSPDGRHLLYQARDGNTFIIEPDQPRHTRIAQPLPVPPPRGFHPWSWSPDGRLLAGWQILPEHPSQTVIVYSFAEQHYERLAEALQGRNPIWLNDSRRLLFADLHKLYLFDLLTKQPREILNLAPHSIGACSLSADNRRLYYSLFASEADIWLLPLQ